MIDQTSRERLFSEAFAICKQVQALLLAARAKHELKAAERKKAA